MSLLVSLHKLHRGPPVHFGRRYREQYHVPPDVDPSASIKIFLCQFDSEPSGRKLSSYLRSMAYQGVRLCTQVPRQERSHYWHGY